MEKDFWLEAWEVGRTRFHNEHTNKMLLKYGQCFQDTQTLFVPLCGKSVDMIYLLSQGKKVIGVELSELAVDAFFKENELTPTIDQLEHFKRYQVGNLTIYCGNFFDLSQKELGEVDGLYDRAALVALPKPMRVDYCGHIKASCPKLKQMLLVSFEYDQTRAEGPPFSVPEDEIREAYSDKFQIERLEKELVEDKNPRFEESGIQEFFQTVFHLKV